MKKVIVHFIVIVLLISVSPKITAQVNIVKANDTALATKVKINDTALTLHVVGVAIENSLPIDGAVVKLYKENEELEWDEVTSIAYHNHDFSFDLYANSYYTIEVSKPGYVSRSIVVLTTLPDEILKDDEKFDFQFVVELFKEKKGVDDFYLDFPVALIKYNKKADQFEMNLKYTNHIKDKIQESTGIKSTKTIKN